MPRGLKALADMSTKNVQGVPQKMSFSDFLALTDVF